jgi:hypothetical protein
MDRLFGISIIVLAVSLALAGYLLAGVAGARTIVPTAAS